MGRYYYFYPIRKEIETKLLSSLAGELGPVSVGQGYCNRSPQTGWTETAEMDPLTVLRLQVHTQGVSRVGSL